MVAEIAKVSGFVMFHPEKQFIVINTFRRTKPECLDVAKEVMQEELLTGEWIVKECVTTYEVKKF